MLRERQYSCRLVSGTAPDVDAGTFVYHPHDSRHGGVCRSYLRDWLRGKRLSSAELKTDKGKVSVDQELWSGSAPNAVADDRGLAVVRAQRFETGIANTRGLEKANGP